MLLTQSPVMMSAIKDITVVYVGLPVAACDKYCGIDFVQCWETRARENGRESLYCLQYGLNAI